MVFAVSHHHLTFFCWTIGVTMSLNFIFVSLFVCKGRGCDAITRGTDSLAQHFIIGIRDPLLVFQI